MRYSDLKPAHIEPSQFMYHLKSLIREELVEKHEQVYRLTFKGKQFIDLFDDENLIPRTHPRITVALVYEHPNKGILLQKRDQQPAFGYVGFLLVDVPLDYSPPLIRFASQRFLDNTGIRIEFQHRGDGYILLMNKGMLEGNMLTHVMYAQGRAEPAAQTEYIWRNDIGNARLLSSTSEVLDLLHNKQEHFFFECMIDLDAEN